MRGFSSMVMDVLLGTSLADGRPLHHPAGEKAVEGAQRKPLRHVASTTKEDFMSKLALITAAAVALLTLPAAAQDGSATAVLADQSGTNLGTLTLMDM